MSREEFLQKWAVNVLDRTDENDLLNEILEDEERPMEERLEEVCQLVIRRNILEMIYDVGYGDVDIYEALKIVRGMFINSSPIVI